MMMIHVHSVCSENVRASQPIRGKVSLLEFPLLKLFAETKSIVNKYNIHVTSLFIF